MDRLEPTDRDVVALLRALHAQDFDGAGAILSTVDPMAFIGVMCGWMAGQGVVAFGSADAWDAELARWQERSAL